MRSLHDAFYSIEPPDGNGLPHPESVVPGYTEPGSLSARFIVEAARSPRSEVRLAATQMRKPLDESPISRHQLPEDFVDPLPLGAPRPRRRPFRVVVRRLPPPPEGRAIKPEHSGPGLTQFFNRGDEVLGPGETRRRMQRGLAFLAIAGIVATGLLSILREDKTGDADFDARQQVIGEITFDDEKLRVLGLCADELSAEADMETHTLGTAVHRRNTMVNINRLRHAAAIARNSDVPVPCEPLSSPAVYRTTVNGVPVSITPADISRFDVATACQQWSGPLPPYTPDALAKMNKLRQELVRKQRIAC